MGAIKDPTNCQVWGTSKMMHCEGREKQGKESIWTMGSLAPPVFLGQGSVL